MSVERCSAVQRGAAQRSGVSTASAPARRILLRVSVCAQRAYGYGLIDSGMLITEPRERQWQTSVVRNGPLSVRETFGTERVKPYA